MKSIKIATDPSRVKIKLECTIREMLDRRRHSNRSLNDSYRQRSVAPLTWLGQAATTLASSQC